jgi:RNA polymerase-binding transcription factor DksA
MASQTKTLLTLLEEKEEKLTQELESQRNGTIKKEVKRKLEEIRLAKERLENDSYGFCEGCFITIPWRELLSMPEKRLCDTCMANAG